MTLAVLVPVKDLARAKTRLAPLMSESERTRLASLLLTGVLEAIGGIPSDAGGEPMRRIVVTAHAASADLAQRLGFEVLHEPQPVSESDSVDRASAQLEAEGARGVLRIPLDLPLVTTSDLLRLMRLIREGCEALAVPSLDGTGTNGLYRRPPTAFPSRFGPDSLALHRLEAQRSGVTLDVVPLSSMALDIDDPADIRAWLSRGTSSPALEFLRASKIETRLARFEAASPRTAVPSRQDG